MSREAKPTSAQSEGPWLIDSRSACALLGIGARSLWSLTKNGAVPSRRIGRCVRYSPVELRRWLERGCPVEAGSGAAIRKEVLR